MQAKLVSVSSVSSSLDNRKNSDGTYCGRNREEEVRGVCVEVDDEENGSAVWSLICTFYRACRENESVTLALA